MSFLSYFFRDRPTVNQKAFLRDLKVRKRPKTKDEATKLIENTIGHWDSIFNQVFPSYFSAPRIVSRRLQIAGRFSTFDQIAFQDKKLPPKTRTLDEDFVRKFVNDTVGEEVATLLSDNTVSKFELEMAVDYVAMYAAAAKVKYKSELYPAAVTGILAREGLLKSLTALGEKAFRASIEGKLLNLLLRENEVNSRLQELLGDKALLKKYRKFK
jgi:hypothetical protein